MIERVEFGEGARTDYLDIVGHFRGEGEAANRDWMRSGCGFNQVAFEVIGNDLALTMAAEGGQLQLNVMEPLIAYKIFDSIRLLTLPSMYSTLPVIET